MSAALVAPQALQDPAAESIEPPSINHDLKSGRILHQACADCPLAEEALPESCRAFPQPLYIMGKEFLEWIAHGDRNHGHRSAERNQGP